MIASPTRGSDGASLVSARRWLASASWRLALGVACAAVAPTRSPPEPPEPSASLVLHGASVVDVETGVVRPATVLVADGRITRVVSSGDSLPTSALPAGARVVDVSGGYVIPGLWDMHVHTTYATTTEVERVLFPQLVAHGVVGIRDPASRFTPQQINRWRAAVAEGRLVGPQLGAIGRVVDARATTIGTVVARTPGEARAAVARLSRGGYDLVKPYNDLSSETYRAMTDEARRLGLAVAGHLPYAVDAAEASRAGQRSIEHLTNLWFETSSTEAEVRGRILTGLARDESALSLFLVKLDTLFPLAFAGWEARREEALFSAFVQGGTWQVPTLVIDRYFALGPEAGTHPGGATARLLPRWVRESGRAVDSVLLSLSPARRATMAELYRREAAMVGRMQRAGVGLLAGTDAPQSYLVPGLALHDELTALVREAGLTPLEALRTATINPARYFGASSSRGAVRDGFAADLVVLDDNPLQDIEAVRRIHAVVIGGRLYDRSQLDAILADVERTVRAGTPR